MKQRIISMLVGLTMMTGASAQRTELIGRGGAPIYLSDSLKVDSMYNYWNDFVSQHPKDDIAWRNLFEICYNQEFKLRSKNWKEGVYYFEKNTLPLLRIRGYTEFHERQERTYRRLCYCSAAKECSCWRLRPMDAVPHSKT